MGYAMISAAVVDVGQGQLTFIQLLDWDENMVGCLMFDCGSDKNSGDTESNLQFLADAISAMTVPAIDCIFFSHSDKDHINLTKQLLTKCSKKPKVKKVIYCGNYDNYDKNGTNILTYLEENGYCGEDDFEALSASKTNYNKETKKFVGSIWKSGDEEDDVRVVAVAGNVSSSTPDWNDEESVITGTRAEELNQVSLISALYFYDICMVICGDATHVTMAAVNGLVSSESTVFKDNIMLTVPHHGSRKTGLGVGKGIKPEDSSVLTVTTFSTLMKPKTCTVSAFEKHSHPSLELMNLFQPTLKTPLIKDTRLKAVNAHQIGVYQDVDLKELDESGVAKNVKMTLATTTNTFTTTYTTTDGVPGGSFNYKLGATTVTDASGVKDDVVINPHACWVYEWAGGRIVRIGGYNKLAGDRFTNVVGSMELEDSDVEMRSMFTLEEETQKRMEPIEIPAVTVRRSSKSSNKIPLNAGGTALKQFS